MLTEFIKANDLSAKVFECNGKVKTSAQAAEQTETHSSKVIVKSILLITSEQDPLLIILLGKDKIDFEKIKKIASVKDVQLADPTEVLEITGYEVGGVPPISIYGIKTLIDEEVVKKNTVICGGGDSSHLMKIKVQEILDNVDEIQIKDIKK